MSSLLIEGGRPISGKIEVEGNKNAALPILAAGLLADSPVAITNVSALNAP